MDADANDVARRFFQTFLQQFVAYRRVKPSVCEAQLTFNDLLELALPADYELISSLIDAFQREELSPENLFTFCLSLPQRFAAAGRTLFPLIDCIKLRPFREEVTLAHELVGDRARWWALAVAGLRRQVAICFMDSITASTAHTQRCISIDER
jgi:hypothetical protein